MGSYTIYKPSQYYFFTLLFEYILYMFLISLCCLGFPRQIWKGLITENTHALLMIWRGSVQFSPLTLLAVGFLKMFFSKVRTFSYIPTLLSIFIINQWCILSRALSKSMWTMIYFLYPVDVKDHTDLFFFHM